MVSLVPTDFLGRLPELWLLWMLPDWERAACNYFRKGLGPPEARLLVRTTHFYSVTLAIQT